MSGTFPTTVYFDDFSTTGAYTVLNPLWGVYDGPGHAGNGLRKPAQVSVVTEATATSNGKALQIVAQSVSGVHWSGGIQLNVPRTYGQFEVRMRIGADTSGRTSGVFLLWPADNNWPAGGELDYWESGTDPDRTPMQTFIHRANPTTGADENAVIYSHTGVDGTAWHKVVGNWAPDELSISIDDGPFILLTSDPAKIPDWPMQVALQLDAFSATPPTSPVVLQVDYVVVRNYVPVAPPPPGASQSMGSTRTVTLIGADGLRRTLVCPGEEAPYQLKSAAGLWGVAPYAQTSRRMGAIPGERLDQTIAQPRLLVVPIQVYGATEAAVDAALGDLGKILRPGSNVRILYKRPSGEEREITAVYQDGADAVTATNRQGYLQRHVTVPAVFKCYWPYWRAVTNSVQSTGVFSLPDGWQSGGPSTLLIVTNSGDVECWPEWRITGYTDYVEAFNLTTGKLWRSDEILSTGTKMRFDTDPRTRGITINEVPFWSLDAWSEPWALAPGENHILVRGSSRQGAPAMGTFEIRWRPNFETC